MANALLGAAQTEAILAEAVRISLGARAAVYEPQFTTLPVQLTLRRRGFVLALADAARWWSTMSMVDRSPLAAAHAAEPAKLLSVIADSHNVTTDVVDRLAGPVTAELRARASATEGATLRSRWPELFSQDGKALREPR